MEGKPDNRLVPSVVSGDPNDRRSIITAASIPAKKLGIKTAQPVSMALRTCPSLVLALFPEGGEQGFKRLLPHGEIATAARREQLLPLQKCGNFCGNF